MRRIVTAALATVSSLVLLFSYPTSHDQAVAGDGDGGGSGDSASAAAPTTTDDGTADGDDEDGDGDGPAASGSASSSAGGSASSSAAKGSAKSGSATTYTGDEVQTRWGVVQVRITVQGGKITASEAVKHPDENPKDVEINDYALPILDKEVVAAQSASIDAVSGATVTSDGYVRSLQSALDAAHL